MKIQYFETTIIDIINLKKTEKALDESENKYRTIVETANEGILIGDKSGNITFANAKMADMLGYSIKELLCTDARTFLDENELKKAEEKLRNRKKGIKEEYEIKFLRKNGEPLWTLANASPIYDKKGTYTNTLVMYTDITQRKKSEEILLENEKKYKDLTELLPQMVFETDKIGNILYVNKSVTNILNYTVMDLIGQNVFKFILPNEHSKATKTFQDILNGEISHGSKFTIIKKDKSQVLVIIYSNVIKKNNKPIGLRSVVVDITEITKKEEEINKQYNILKGITDSNNAPIFSIDNDYCYTSFNLSHEMEMKLLYDVEIEYGKNFIKYLRPKERLRAKNGFNRALTGETFTYEHYFGNTKKYLELTLNPIKDAGKIVGVAVFSQDITKRKLAEEALVISEEKYKILFEEDPNYNIIIDNNGLIYDVNYATTKLTGLTKKELIGMNFSELKVIAPEDMSSHLNKIKKVWNGEHIEPFETRYINWNNKNIWSIVNLTLMNFGNVNYILGIAVDITKQKNVENRIKSSLKEKNVLLQEIHHRVKNNMQIISSLLNLQIKYVHDEEAVNVLQESQNRVKSLAMIHEKLYMSKDLTKINFVDYVQSLVSNLFYAYNIEKTHIQPILQIEDINLNMETAIPCGLIISELVSNSLKYAFPNKKSGEIRVSLKSQKDTYKLLISDNGIGLSNGIELNNAQTLGLKLVYILTDQIDGKVTIYREQGTQYKITFKELTYKERI